MPNAEQVLHQTEKSSNYKILQYSQENTCVKFLGTPILKNICIQMLLSWLYELTVWDFVSGSHLKPSWNQSFKQNLVHMPSIYLTPILSGKPRFCMFIINSYFTKSKCLFVVLGLLIKKCNNILFCVIWLDRKYCTWNCVQWQYLNQYIKFID